jgi:arylsulfatase A-like enzyme
VYAGYDYINRAESTLGNVMADGGYKTAHFGKWHNGRTLGYEPWEMGFHESWLPTSHVHLDNLMRWAQPGWSTTMWFSCGPGPKAGVNAPSIVVLFVSAAAI